MKTYFFSSYFPFTINNGIGAGIRFSNNNLMTFPCCRMSDLAFYDGDSESGALSKIENSTALFLMKAKH